MSVCLCPYCHISETARPKLHQLNVCLLPMARVANWLFSDGVVIRDKSFPVWCVMTSCLHVTARSGVHARYSQSYSPGKTTGGEVWCVRLPCTVYHVTV